ncbi:hypothetical protein ACFE04_006921 [Oxalis oulophora]
MGCFEDRLSTGGYYRNNTFGESSQGLGSSGRLIHAAMSQDSTRKSSINFNLDKKWESFGVPTQLLPLSKMSSSERIDLIHRLRLELEQIRVLRNKAELHRTMNDVLVHSASDILSSTNNGNNNIINFNGRQPEKFRPSAVMMTAGPGRKVNHPTGQKARNSNKGSSEGFQQEKLSDTMATFLTKDCDNLLKRLMSHKYSWVFNTPVDVVKLNIPDYFTVIKQPMDLGTVKRKLASKAYLSPLEFADDVRLTFKNAMTYNPSTNDVHIMADALSKFFELRWKTIEKKLPVSYNQPLPLKTASCEDIEVMKSMPSNKKQKVISVEPENVPQRIIRKMTDGERLKLGGELESIMGEMPVNIIEFLRNHSSNGGDSGEDEIEIDIDALSDETLFTLRKLLDDYLLEKQKNQARVEPCEIEMVNVSGLSNSSMPVGKENGHTDEVVGHTDEVVVHTDEVVGHTDEVVDIGGIEPPPVSEYPRVEIEKDIGNKNSKHVESGNSSDSGSSSSSDSETDDHKPLSPGCESKVPEPVEDIAVQKDEMTTDGDLLAKTLSGSALDPNEQSPQQKPCSIESDFLLDGDDSAPSERPVSPEKLYRAALLRNRFADTIFKAREKTLTQADKSDPEKLRREREELELQKKKDKARLQAEAKAAEEARKQAEAEAAAEAKRKREHEREAARQALLQMEKTVEINENSRFLEDLEMLRTAPAEQLPSTVDETSPDHRTLDVLGSFNFGSNSNPLEQLGLYMKEDEEEEEADQPPPPPPQPTSVPTNPDPVNENDVEEGEID